MSQAGILTDNSTALPDIETITGNLGGAVGPDALHNVNLLGAGGVTVTGVPGTNTLTINVAGLGVIAWTREPGAAVAAAVNHGYINTNAGLTTFTLPAVAAVGDIVLVCGEGAGGWTIAANAGQTIQVATVTTSVAGSVSSTNRYDSVTLVCRVANTAWQSMSHEGVYNIV